MSKRRAHVNSKKGGSFYRVVTPNSKKIDMTSEGTADHSKVLLGVIVAAIAAFIFYIL